MIINGRLISQTIESKLKSRVSVLKTKGIVPTLAIILIGDDPASVTYVEQKKKKGEEIGIRVIVDKKPVNFSQEQLISTITGYNNNPNIHGIIVQIPLPLNFDQKKILDTISVNKDVDGFKNESDFLNPLVKAVFYIFQYIIDQKPKPQYDAAKIINFLINKKIVIIGKGDTGGKPLFGELKKLTENVIQIDSKTINPDIIIKEGDIVISCVGEKNIVNGTNLKNGAIVIGVGLHKENNQLLGDFEDWQINNIASFYTPTPGGIGPINVICLMENVVASCQN